jgi:hypothetical protein
MAASPSNTPALAPRWRSETIGGVFVPWAVTGAAFLLCFGVQLWDLIHAWIRVPDAEHGLLIAPVAVWLAYRIGLRPDRRPGPLFSPFRSRRSCWDIRRALKRSPGRRFG